MQGENRVLVLADRGELRLTDGVVKFSPEFSGGARAEITIQQLLTPASGLPDRLPENDILCQRHASLADLVKGALHTPLLFAPGTKYRHRSMGILLAADVVERVTKSSLPKFLANEVFKPPGMTRSALGLGSFKVGDVVRCQTEHTAPEAGGGDPKAPGWDWNGDYWRNLAAPRGGAHGSAADVGLFLNSFMHADGKVLREATARHTIQNHTEGLGARSIFPCKIYVKKSQAHRYGHPATKRHQAR